MGKAPPPRFDVEALHRRLCEKVAEVRPLVVADVTRVFLEVSSLPCDPTLWSLEFTFDEDDGRIARLGAPFAKHRRAIPSIQDPHGYDRRVPPPKGPPPPPAADGLRPATLTPESAAGHDSLAARFVRALAELGAYRTIETL